MKVVIKEDLVYGHKGKRVSVSAGECDLPEFVAKSWIKQGLATEAKAVKASPKKVAAPKNKMIDPVEEVKEAPKKRGRRKKSE